MTRPHNQKPEDIRRELVKRLIAVGLEPEMIKIIKGNLALDTKRDFLSLSSEIRDQAFKTANDDNKRQTVKLVQMIVKYLGKALEMEGEGDERRPPGGRRGIWRKMGLPPELQPPESDPEKEKNAPRTAKEFYSYYSSFLDQNLGGFQFDDETKEDLAKRAAEVQDELMEVYGLKADEAATLTKISFYDIFFLCDDSGSMIFGTRKDALSQALQSVSFWATKIEPSGISLRFLNYTEDNTPEYDYLTDAKTIDQRIMDVFPLGPTYLGSMLQRKVIRPLQKRAQDYLNQAKDSKMRIKPRIIIIITDGAPTDGDCLRDVISYVKTEGLSKKFGPAVTIFLLAQVGDDEDAVEYLEDLVNDEELSSMLYTLNKPLDEIKVLLASEVGDKFENAYQTLWMRLFNAALNTQTN